jgi:hypothetical protein
MEKDRNLAPPEKEITKRAEEIKPEKLKKEEKPIQPPAKQYYTIKMEVTAPVTLTYRILAENAEQALELVMKSPMTVPMVAPPKPVLNRMKKLKASVYLAGTSLVKLVKNL